MDKAVELTPSTGEDVPIITVGVVIIEGDKILLVRHEEGSEHIPGTYGIPSGRPKDGESLAAAAVRELYEETGLVALEDDLAEVPNRYEESVPRADGTTPRFIGVGFICQPYTGTLRSSKETTPEWAKLNKLNELPLLPGLQKALETALA